MRSCLRKRHWLVPLIASLIVGSFAAESQACHNRRRCVCKHVPVVYVTPCPRYIVVPQAAMVAAPVMATAQAPIASPQGQQVLVTPSGKRYFYTVSNEPGTEEELKEKREEELKKMTPLERSTALANSDNFAGTDRKAAKTSISTAQVETFSVVDDLLDSLPDDSSMRSHTPPIPQTAGSDRVTEEQRNVSVTAFLYAVKSESDNDFHVIIGTDDPASSRRYMNVEISGLPPTGPARAPLKAVRDKFKAQFANAPIGSSYHKFNPPIPVQVTGSIFFDMDHVGGTVGPSGMRPATAWEIHPVTDIDFTP